MLILVGSHGTGKTTLLEAYKNKWGLNIRDGISRPVHKITNKFKLSGYVEQSLINELTFFYWKYNKDIPDVGMTRSVVDCVVYSKVLGYEDLYEECIKRFETLDLSDVTFCYIPIEFPLEDDGVRYTDPELQRKIDDEIKNELIKLNIPYHTITGTIEQRVEQLKQIIDKYEKKL